MRKLVVAALLLASGPVMADPGGSGGKGSGKCAARIIGTNQSLYQIAGLLTLNARGDGWWPHASVN